MISEFILNIVFNITSGILSAIPDFTIDLDSSWFEYFLSICKVAGYLLPMNTVRMILSLILSLTFVRITVSLGKTLWDLLPFA